VTSDSPGLPAALTVFVFIVAMLYSSVGHGGASGYLAVMSLLSVPPAQMSTTALILNLLVAGISYLAFLRAGHFSGKLTGPFLVTSVPAAFLGALIHIPLRAYQLLLAAVLVFAAFRLAVPLPKAMQCEHEQSMPVGWALAAGALIGLLSGIVGVGGGIFLSPLMILMNWADMKRTAATSACFILVNSAAGLCGRGVGNTLEVGTWAPLVVAAAVGGLTGSYLGANRLSGMTLRRILAAGLCIAAVKLVMTAAH